MTRVDRDLDDLGEVADGGSDPTREVYQGLALILRGVLLGVGVEDRPLRLTWLREGYLVADIEAAEQRSYEGLLPS